jgi:hypothetical protein
VFTAEGVGILASPPQATRANAICEKVIGALRRELSGRSLIVNEYHLRQVLTEYLRHYKQCPAAPFSRPARVGSGSHPATGDQPRRAPDPPETSPRRTHARVPDHRLTAPRCDKKRAGHLHNRVFEPHTIAVADFASLPEPTIILVYDSAVLV